jgi:hypothetical protein
MELKKKSVSEYLSNRTLYEDFGLLLKNTGKIYKLFYSNNKTNDNGFQISDLKKILRIDFNKLKGESLISIGNKDSNIIYVNGILTDKKEALEQKDYLNKLLSSKIEVLHNDTGGLFVDLLESSYGRNLLKRSDISIKLSKEILKKLKKSKESITLIGHSQGAIIINNALELVQNECDIEDLKRINFFTFGAAISQCVLNNSIKTEHFANIDDPIPNLGILIKGISHNGTIHTRDSSGHSFIDYYLKPFEKGEFGKENFFNKLIESNKLKDLLKTNFLNKDPLKIKNIQTYKRA